jgi:DNA polymerase-3 subunit epsilon
MAIMAVRQIVLDTETTGLDPNQGHRIIEIGCVELVNRRITGQHFHHYLNPDREIDAGAMAVHGIKNEFVADKPRFHEVVVSFLDFVKDAELIIHNAAFDVGFLNKELLLCQQAHSAAHAQLHKLDHYCQITDTLLLARRKHAGQKNNLDALCKRYQVNNQHRDLHGALLDAQLLAEVYLAMTGGQLSLDLSLDTQEKSASANASEQAFEHHPLAASGLTFRVIAASTQELEIHEQRLLQIQKKSGNCLWLNAENLVGLT